MTSLRQWTRLIFRMASGRLTSRRRIGISAWVHDHHSHGGSEWRKAQGGGDICSYQLTGLESNVFVSVLATLPTCTRNVESDLPHVLYSYFNQMCHCFESKVDV